MEALTPSSDLGSVGIPHAGSATATINVTRTTATSVTLPDLLRESTPRVIKMPNHETDCSCVQPVRATAFERRHRNPSSSTSSSIPRMALTVRLYVPEREEVYLA